MRLKPEASIALRLMDKVRVTILLNVQKRYLFECSVSPIMANVHITHPISYAEADIMGQFPVLSAYTMLMYGFQLPLDAHRNSVVLILQKTFDDLVARIPLFGCQVGTNEGRSSDSSSLAKQCTKGKGTCQYL